MYIYIYIYIYICIRLSLYIYIYIYNGPLGLDRQHLTLKKTRTQAVGRPSYVFVVGFLLCKNVALELLKKRDSHNSSLPLRRERDTPPAHAASASRRSTCFMRG